jgi:hypothetical protein
MNVTSKGGGYRSNSNACISRASLFAENKPVAEPRRKPGRSRQSGNEASKQGAYNAKP